MLKVTLLVKAPVEDCAGVKELLCMELERAFVGTRVLEVVEVCEPEN